LIRTRAIAVGVGAASVREIDQLNIYHATHLAMRRAIARIGEHDHVLVDGNRIAGFEAAVGPYSNVVDGDARVYSIACASVVAKVVRDRMMELLALRYPGYGWEPDAVPPALVPGPPAHACRGPARAGPPRGPVCVGRDPRVARPRASAGHGGRRDARRARPGVPGDDRPDRGLTLDPDGSRRIRGG
jgi:hypothetical protein